MGISEVQKPQNLSNFRIGSQCALNAEQFNMSTMGERGLQLEVIALFQTQLNTVAKRSSKSDAKFLAHTLRGAALAIGADEIAAIAGLWEDQALSRVQLDGMLHHAETRFHTAIDLFFQKS